MTPHHPSMSDEALSALVAEHCAGWTDIKRNPLPGLFHCGFNEAQGKTAEANCGSPWGIPPYATSADAVLPLLEKYRGWSSRKHNYNPKLRTVELEVTCEDGDGYSYAHGDAPTFARAACFCLLRAAGQKVEES